jgi:hypothetical protein
VKIKNCLKLTFLSLIFLLSFTSKKTAAFSGSGSGTELDPYLITNCTQVQEMQDDLDGYYELANNVDCTASSGWTWDAGSGIRPIGGMWGGPPTPAGATQDTDVSTYTGAPAYSFQGTLDGKNFTISNIYIESGVPYSALFGVSNGATIKNLNINSATNNNSSNLNETAILIGYAKNTTISNSNISGVITTPQGMNSLVVGNLDDGSSISDTTATFNNQEANGVYKFGGLAGYMSNNTSIDNSSVTGTINTTAVYETGCLVGATGHDGETITTTASITNSYSDCIINNAGSSSYDLAGIVGRAKGDVNISNNYFTGSITDIGDANSSFNIATIVGEADGATVDNCYSTGTISLLADTHTIGSLVGYLIGSSTLSNSYSTGSVTVNTGASYIGGLVGRNTSGSQITDSYFKGQISIGDNGTWIGGLVGMNNAANIIDSYVETTNFNSGNTTTFIGGLTGQNLGTASISKSYFKGSLITSDDTTNIGGLVGNNVESSISNTYVNASITSGASTTFFGGLVGSSNDANINNSYATTTVSLGVTGAPVGGLLGYINDSGSGTVVSNSYWDQTRSGLATSAAGTAYSTTQMKDSANFIGWDFDTIWAIHSTVNDGYPFIGTAPADSGTDSSDSSNSSDSDDSSSSDSSSSSSSSSDTSSSNSSSSNTTSNTPQIIFDHSAPSNQDELSEEEQEALDISQDQNPGEDISDNEDLEVSIDDNPIEEGEDETRHVYEGEEIEIEIPADVLTNDEEESDNNDENQYTDSGDSNYQEEDSSNKQTTENSENKEIDKVFAVLNNEVEEMQYNDENDSYQGSLSSKGLDGEQTINIITFFENGEKQKQNIDILVDPKGYIYYVDEEGNEIKVVDATVKLYQIIDGKRILYDSEKQKSTQKSNKDGEYAYYVEPGEYILVIEKDGFENYESDIISVKTNLIEKKIELKVKGASTSSGELFDFNFNSIINIEYAWIYISILVVIILLIAIRKILKEDK